MLALSVDGVPAEVLSAAVAATAQVNSFAVFLAFFLSGPLLNNKTGPVPAEPVLAAVKGWTCSLLMLGKLT